MEVIETDVSEFIDSRSACSSTRRPLRFGCATPCPEKFGRYECEPSDRISRSFEQSPCRRNLRPSRRESATGAARNACAALAPTPALTPTPQLEHRRSGSRCQGRAHFHSMRGSNATHSHRIRGLIAQITHRKWRAKRNDATRLTGREAARTSCSRRLCPYLRSPPR